MPPLTPSQRASGAASLLAITNDGSLLATIQGTLCRLDVNTDRWQSLGPLPSLASSTAQRPATASCGLLVLRQLHAVADVPPECEFIALARCWTHAWSWPTMVGGR